MSLAEAEAVMAVIVHFNPPVKNPRNQHAVNGKSSTRINQKYLAKKARGKRA